MVIAYSVSQRTRDIGVRMARRSTAQFGVQACDAAGGVANIGRVGRWARLCSVGAALSIRSLLFGVKAWDEAWRLCFNGYYTSSLSESIALQAQEAAPFIEADAHTAPSAIDLFFRRASKKH